jgi:hypothetical protein|tara:strand:+ start:77 stop:742 length:666 start_codon:yes stop_codon:yes gene_type:complete
MATSNSRDFELDVSDAIEEAYERCGLEVKTGYDLRTARRSLNIMFSEWANRGLNLWTVEQKTQALTSGTASYTFTADHADLLEVVIRRSGTDFSLSRMSRGDYLNLPNKDQSGRPSQYYFDRRITPAVILWPTPDSSSDSLIYYYVRRIQDADTMQNTHDIPFRFLPCLVAGLSYYLSMKKAPDRIQILKSVYEEEFQRASDEDEDRVPLKLTPDIKYLRV